MLNAQQKMLNSTLAGPAGRWTIENAGSIHYEVLSQGGSVTKPERSQSGVICILHTSHTYLLRE
jgi:hypothetical protein